MHHPSWHLSVSSTLATLASAGVGVDFLARRQGRIVRIWANDPLAELLGTTRSVLLDLPVENGLPPEAVWALEGLLGGENGASPRVFDAALVAYSGSPIRVRAAFRRAHLDGEPIVVRCFSRTQNPQAIELALQQSDRRFRDLLEAAPDAIVIVQDGRLVYANHAALEIGGHQALEEALGTPFSARVHPDDLPNVAKRVEVVMTSARWNPPAEIRFLRTDGTPVPVEVVSMPTQWEGRPALLAIGRDLSRRREAWVESIHADRISAVGTLAAGIAHEINNPLAYVLLNLQYIVRELPKLARHPDQLERLRGRLDEARHGADRVRSIVRDLRDFSLPRQTEEGPVDLVRVMESALKVATRYIEGSAAVVRDYLPAPHARGDAARLEQVFLNLITNAVQALPPARRAQNRLHVRVAPGEPGRVTAEVSDNGVGISPDLIDRVFDPFFTTKPVGVGTGLGLPICFSIVAALGGTISVESQPGRGTTFRVKLAAMSVEAVEEIPTPPPPVATSARRARVLVIDDDLPVAEVLQRLLADDFEVEVATSATQALALVRQGPDFDVLLCDLLMPGMSGVDLYGELERDRPGVEERVIFMTGGAFTPRSAEFLAKVRNDRLEKPLDLVELRRAVRRAVERAK
ncbi:MAG: response regulator [Polyangiaceae bacterium]|nr:response regulator [Polyangiaceae bacterium]